MGVFNDNKIAMRSHEKCRMAIIEIVSNVGKTPYFNKLTEMRCDHFEEKIMFTAFKHIVVVQDTIYDLKNN